MAVAPAAVVADPLAAVVAVDAAFLELLQPRSPMEATIATDIRAARLRGTDIEISPLWRQNGWVRAVRGADHGNSVEVHPKDGDVNKP